MAIRSKFRAKVYRLAVVPTSSDTFRTVINIRDISIKCGQCGTYQTLASFTRREEWNVYTYECENERCDPAVTRTLVEVPRELDAFARRDPGWRGGGKHGEEGSGTAEE